MGRKTGVIEEIRWKEILGCEEDIEAGKVELAQYLEANTGMDLKGGYDMIERLCDATLPGFSAGMEREVGRQILQECQGSFDAALEKVQKQHVPPEK